MRIGGAMFFTDYSMSPTELARALGGARFQFALGARTLPHSVDAKVALPQRRRSTEEIYDVMDPFVVLGAAAAAKRCCSAPAFA